MIYISYKIKYIIFLKFNNNSLFRNMKTKDLSISRALRLTSTLASSKNNVLKRTAPEEPVQEEQPLPK